MQSLSPIVTVQLVFGILQPSTSSDSLHQRRSENLSISSFPSVSENVIGPVMQKLCPPVRRGTRMMCCEFRPCTKMGGHYRLPLRLDCSMAHNEKWLALSP